MWLPSGSLNASVRACGNGTPHVSEWFHHLSEPSRQSRNYTDAIRVKDNINCSTYIVHIKLQSHRRRGLLQVHQLGEDVRIPAGILEDGDHYGSENMSNSKGDSTPSYRSLCSS